MDDGRKTQVTFQYIVNSTKWDVEKPYRIHDLGHDCIGDVAASNLAFESRPSMVNDIRGKDENLRLEDCGFKYSKFSPSAVPGSSDSATLTYCNEVVALLHRHVSAERIICYDLRYRRNDESRKDLGRLTNNKDPDRPVEAVHVDHTRGQGWSRVAHHLTSVEQKVYLNGDWRIKIFNVWKPLNTVVQDMPLAILDPRTIREEDLVHCDSVGPGFNAEISYVKANEDQKWYWMSAQTCEEALIFLEWDSHAPQEPFTFCPHASFKDPSSPKDAPPRESVEARLMTFEKLK